jgi:hypothetical protein
VYGSRLNPKNYLTNILKDDKMYMRSRNGQSAGKLLIRRNFND